MVSVVLISVLNIKLTCEWHKAIKLNYKKTRTHVIVVLRVSSTIRDTWMPSTDVKWLTTSSPWRKYICSLGLACAELPSYDTTLKYGHGWDCQLTGTMRGPARRPHFSLAIMSVTVQLWTYVFWVISIYFNIRNTLPKSGTFLLWHPV